MNALGSRWNDVSGNSAADYQGLARGTTDLSTSVGFADFTKRDFHLGHRQGTTDRGDPADDFSAEPAPNGGRINLDAFGGTAEAEVSVSPSSAVASSSVTGGTPVPGQAPVPAPGQTQVTGGCNVAGNSTPAEASGLLASGLVGLLLVSFVLLRRRRLAVVAGAVLCTWLASRTAGALTCTWNQSTPQNFNGSTAFWTTCARVPTSADDVVFSNAGTGTCTLTAAATVNSLSMNTGAGTFAQATLSLTTIGNLTINAGTYTGGTAKTVVGGDFVQTGGTYTSTSNRLEVNGAFTKTTGTFNHGNGEVMLRSNGTKFLATNGAAFYDLIINDGMVGYWPLDETSGTTAVNKSGFYTNYVYTGTAPTQSSTSLPPLHFADPRYLTFAGGASTVASVASFTPYETDLTSNYTLSAWVKATNLSGSAPQGIITFGRDVAKWWGLWMDGSERFLAGSATANATGGAATGSWQHVAIVQIGSGSTNRRYIYINGVDTTVGTPAASDGNAGLAGTMVLGRGTTSEYFTGSIDDIRVYDRALSTTEIASLAAGDCPQSTGGGIQTLTGAPSVANDFTLASGTFVLGANILTVTGNWLNYGGILTATSAGGVTFDGAAAGGTILVGGSTMGDITISGTGGTGAWAISDTGNVKLAGNLNITAGTFTSTAGLLNVQGAFSETGGTFTHNLGRVMLSSTANRTFASNGAIFNDLIINDGLVGYWKLDETASPSVDSSGYGQDATWVSTPSGVSTVPTVNFTNPKSLSVDGSADYAAFTSVDDAPVVTVAAWIKATGDGGGTVGRILEGPGYLVVVNGTGHTAPDNSMALGFTSNRATTNGEWRSPVTSLGYDGSWYHVAVTYDSSNPANNPVMYINGVSRTVSNKVAPPVGAQRSNAGAAYIGNRPLADRYLNGLVDELRIYNRVLTANEIYSLYIGNQPGTSVATVASPTQSLTGSPTVNGDLTIASGILAASASDFNVKGSWLNYGGLFTAASTQVVTFNGTSGSHVIRSAGQSFGGITVNGTGSTWTLEDSLEMNPASTLTITAGTFSLSSASPAYTFRGGNIDKTAAVAMTPGTGKVVLDGNTSFNTDQGTFTDLRLEPVAATKLVGYWKLDAGQGTTAKDYGSGAHDGTLTGGPLWTDSTLPPLVSFYDPAALTFNGANYVDISTAATPSNAAFSACGWVNYTSVSGDQNLVTTNGTHVSGWYLKKDAASGHFSFQMLSSDSTGATLYFATGATTTPTTGTWYHLCGVYNGANALLYVNGALEATSATVASTWNATGHTVIGTALWNDVLANYTTGTIDDVRIYNVALTLAQVAALRSGTYPAGLSGTPTYGLGANTTVSGTFALDSGTLATSTFTMDATSASVANVYSGTYLLGSTGTTTGSRFRGGLTVNKYGTLDLPTSGGNVYIDNTKALTIDGTLSASSATATIQSFSSTYAFIVGSTASATPTLNITGLAVKNTDASGMNINIVHNPVTSTTTFTRFDGIAFSSGVSGAGNRLLQIYAPTLYLVSNGCTFDASTGTTGKNVTLIGDTTTTETRAIFGNATCTSPNTPCESYDDDDDSDTDGVGGAGANGGSVIQWTHSALSDTSGTLVGFPVAAFDWNTFTYYSSYVAYHDVTTATGADRLYVRDSNGNPSASYATPYWDGPSGEDFVGAPRFDTDSVSGKHYVYLATTAGKVYRLEDNTTTHTLTLATGWSANPYVCACTISTPLTVDTTNIYWGGVASGNKVWTLIKSTGALPTSPASPVTVTNVISGAAPTVWVDGSAHNQMFLGSSAVFYKVDATNQSTTSSYSTSVSGTVNGRISLINSRMYGADNAGTLFVLDPATITTLLWKYANPDASAVTSSVYVDFLLNYAYYGDSNGHLLAAKFNTGTSGTNLTGFPYMPTSGSASDVYGSAVLYDSNILVAGTTTGNVYIVDTSSGTPVMRQTYKFGPTTNVSGIGYNKQTTSYMVSTSDPTTKDGKLFYIDRVIKLN